MKRRTYLILAGGLPASTAGCTLLAPGPTPTDSGTPTSFDQSPTPEGAQRRVRLVGQDESPEGFGIEMSVEVVRDIITDKQTAVVELDINNREGPRYFNFESGRRCTPFDRQDGLSKPEGVALFEEESTEEYDRVDGKWSRDTDISFYMYGCQKYEHEADESMTIRYELWDWHLSEGYFPPGEYRWDTTVKMWDSRQDALRHTERVRFFDWGFSLQVDNV